MLDHELARARMVEFHLARRGITDPRALAASRTIPREDLPRALVPSTGQHEPLDGCAK
jgi:protein-L-isoaspartate O-methyltransferase